MPALQSIRNLPAHPFRCATLLAILTLLINTAIALHRGVPHPIIEDEYSYLFASDTFSHFRLTNPTPPFPEHFEAPHILVRPTYMSKYPPGQGLILAAGQLLTHLPIVGVWLVAAGAIAALYWALLGFLPPPWALLGGCLALFHPQLLIWSQTYWGASLAFLGGAILLGAWVQLLNRPTTSLAVLYGIGLAILANTRPYEGLVISIPLSIALISHFKKIVLPIVAVLIPVAIFSLYYNYRITGHPLRMPFMEYSAQYDIYPKFWFLPKNPEPHYSSQAIADIHTKYEPGDYDRLRTFGGAANIFTHRLGRFILMHTQRWSLLIDLAAALFLLRDRKFRWIASALTVFVAGLFAENIVLAYYAGPATALMLLLIIAGWKWLNDFSLITRIAAILAFGVWIVFAVISAAGPPSADALRVTRDALIADYPQLASHRHLIFVKFEPKHSYHDEWVYNGADLDNEPILWVRYLGPQVDEPVIQHFTGRSVWLLDVGEEQLTFNVYPSVK